MILSQLRLQIQDSTFIPELDKSVWLERLSGMNENELQALAGILKWMDSEEKTGESLKRSIGPIMKKAFAALNKNAYTKTKKLILEQLEKDLD